MENIAPALLEWFYKNQRILPFRTDPSPYHVWLSEIMLQQTRVSAALPYYERFLAALPDIPALAACEEEKLHKLWEGLGYYSRVRNLQKAARIVCEQYGGQLPADYDALRALPGIGDYTAGAKLSAKQNTCNCGRTQYPCTEIANEVERRLQGCKKSIKVAVMGCVVNGPGEAREADIGIAGGKGEAVLFVHGNPVKKLTGDNILDQFMEEIYKL